MSAKQIKAESVKINDVETKIVKLDFESVVGLKNEDTFEIPTIGFVPVADLKDFVMPLKDSMSGSTLMPSKSTVKDMREQTRLFNLTPGHAAIAKLVYFTGLDIPKKFPVEFKDSNDKVFTREISLGEIFQAYDVACQAYDLQDEYFKIILKSPDKSNNKTGDKIITSWAKLDEVESIDASSVDTEEVK